MEIKNWISIQDYISIPFFHQKSLEEIKIHIFFQAFKLATLMVCITKVFEEENSSINLELVRTGGGFHKQSVQSI